MTAMGELEALRQELAMARADAAHARAEKAQAEALADRLANAVANECSVCMETSCDVALVPCGHVLCVRCSLTAVANGACFTCTAPIEKLPKEIPIQLYI